MPRGKRGHSPLTHLEPNRWDGKGREGERKGREKEGEKKFRERSSTFSLNFPTIKPLVSGRAIDKVLPRSESFKLRLETRSFNKLQEVGVFSYSV